jgi:hypothetical protein
MDVKSPSSRTNVHAYAFPKAVDRKFMAPLLVPSNVNLYKQYFYYFLLCYTMSNIALNVLENVKMINTIATAR